MTEVTRGECIRLEMCPDHLVRMFQYLSWSSPVTLFDNSRSFTLDSLFDEFSKDLLVSFFGHRINALAVAAADPDAR